MQLNVYVFFKGRHIMTLDNNKIIDILDILKLTEQNTDDKEKKQEQDTSQDNQNQNTSENQDVPEKNDQKNEKSEENSQEDKPQENTPEKNIEKDTKKQDEPKNGAASATEEQRDKLNKINVDLTNCAIELDNIYKNNNLKKYGMSLENAYKGMSRFIWPAVGIGVATAVILGGIGGWIPVKKILPNIPIIGKLFSGDKTAINTIQNSLIMAGTSKATSAIYSFKLPGQNNNANAINNPAPQQNTTNNNTQATTQSDAQKPVENQEQNVNTKNTTNTANSQENAQVENNTATVANTATQNTDAVNNENTTTQTANNNTVEQNTMNAQTQPVQQIVNPMNTNNVAAQNNQAQQNTSTKPLSKVNRNKV